jgi:WG containing repeat
MKKSGKIVSKHFTSIVTTPDPDDPGPYESGGNNHIQIIVNGKFGITDKSGKIIVEPIYDNARLFSEGLSTVQLGNKYGLINEKGNFVLPMQEMKYLGRLCNGLVSFCISDKYGFLDKTGQEKIKPQFELTSEFSERLCWVQNEKGLHGYIDTLGRLVIPYTFQNAYDFLRGQAVVQLNGVWGVIDKTGKFVEKAHP